jgi:hypothetical protein
MNPNKTQIPENHNNGAGRLNKTAYRDGYITVKLMSIISSKITVLFVRIIVLLVAYLRALLSRRSHFVWVGHSSFSPRAISLQKLM